MPSPNLLETKYTKGIAVLTFINVLLVVTTIIWSMILTQAYAEVWHYLTLAFSYLGLRGGLQVYKRQYGGLKLLAFFFGLQTFAITTPSFFFNLMYGINLSLTFSTNNYAVKINFFALILFALVLELMWEHWQAEKATNPAISTAQNQ